jgi:hypothetical protein
MDVTERFLCVYIQTTRGFRFHTFCEDNKLGGKEAALKATNFKHYTVNNGQCGCKPLVVFMYVESVLEVHLLKSEVDRLIFVI